ncbi:hypothetical protein M758_4G075800 [Ceratodon purpureus]|nr:hypothetical protein M758_4G075800 [Ceratodon purpureus]
MHSNQPRLQRLLLRPPPLLRQLRPVLPRQVTRVTARRHIQRQSAAGLLRSVHGWRLRERLRLPPLRPLLPPLLLYVPPRQIELIHLDNHLAAGTRSLHSFSRRVTPPLCSETKPEIKLEHSGARTRVCTRRRSQSRQCSKREQRRDRRPVLREGYRGY